MGSGCRHRGEEAGSGEGLEASRFSVDALMT